MALTLTILTVCAMAPGEEGDWLTKAKGPIFRYTGLGRRDPFLFMTKVREIPAIDSSLGVLGPAEAAYEFMSTPTNTGREETSQKAPPVGATVGAALAELHKGNFEKARALAENAQRKVSEQHSAELVQMVERVHRASAILTRRKQVEQDFSKLPIRVDAIFWKPEEPVAIINGRTQHEGDVLDNQLQIYKIEKSGVVFLYNFLKVRKRLGWSTGTSVH